MRKAAKRAAIVIATTINIFIAIDMFIDLLANGFLPIASMDFGTDFVKITSPKVIATRTIRPAKIYLIASDNPLGSETPCKKDVPI